MSIRRNSYAFCGGAFGDEGKGRIVDEYVNNLSAKGRVIVYRDNGGANAGHTVSLPTGEQIALHQLPSGIFSSKAKVVLGKGMVIHPGDLIEELGQVDEVAKKLKLAKIIIDEMAVLSLDTHRAYEGALKAWQEGGKGSTGRGISPAYADVLLRHPLRMRDLKPVNKSAIEKHYLLYQALLKGLGVELAGVEVPTLSGKPHKIGSLKVFMSSLARQAKQLTGHIQDVSGLIKTTWADTSVGYVFEKAQAIGLDARWGVYPDVTASDTTFGGIFSATEGIIDPNQIQLRAATIKATYMSSVGARRLPTLMEERLAHRIREDAHEYGATTKRPRDIAYLDLPALRYYGRVGMVNAYVLTHMDISYLDAPIKICVKYTLNGKRVDYRPDQEYLLKVKPVYKQLDPWDAQLAQKARSRKELPAQAKRFLAFIEKELGSKILMITTGPQRNQSIHF